VITIKILTITLPKKELTGLKEKLVKGRGSIVMVEGINSRKRDILSFFDTGGLSKNMNRWGK
jgi:hypothetical protein